jgi:ABC-type Fe3+-citrate transport system substrate-binding protein
MTLEVNTIMRKQLWRSAAALIITAVAVAGCSTGGSSNSPSAPTDKVKATSNAAACGQDTRTITHELGSTKITGTPQRVVALEFSFIDALAAVDVKPVGVADVNDPGRIIQSLRDKIAGYTSVGLRQSPSLQEISALKPDLIIADTERDKTIYDQLSKIAPTIVFSSLDTGYQAILDQASAIGQALNKCDQMDQRLAQHKATMAALKAKIPAGGAPTFLYGVSSEKQFSGYAANAYAPSVLESLGLKSMIPSQTGTGQVSMNLETFVSDNAPLVFAAEVPGTKTLLETWEKSPLFKNIQAQKDNKVFVVDQNVWSRNRGMVAAEMIAQDAINKLYGS